MTRLTTSARFALAALLVLAGCSPISDALAPGREGTPPARLAFTASIPRFQTAAFANSELRITVEYETSAGFTLLGAERIQALTTASTQQVPIELDLADCIRDGARIVPSSEPNGCNLRLTIRLFGDGQLLDTGIVGPLVVAPGASVTAPSTVQLFEVSAVTIDVLDRDPPVPSPLPLISGETVTLRANARDAANRTVSGKTTAWSSRNVAVATVNDAGVVTAISPGSAQIDATVGGQQATLSVLVSPPTAAVSIEAGDVAGDVTVTSSPAGINCLVSPLGTSGTCSAQFQRGSNVELLATAALGSLFDGWVTNGGCAPSNLSPLCTVSVPNEGRTVVLNTDRFVTVRVRPDPENTSLSGQAAIGVITADLGLLGDGCQLGGPTFGGTCEFQLPSKRSARLIGTPTNPTTNAAFVLQDACDQTTAEGGLSPATCTLSPPHAALQTVQLSLDGPESITTGGEGLGSGTIRISPTLDCLWNGLQSSGTCFAVGRAGDVARVTAIPNSGSTFAGWRVDGALTLVPALTLDLVIDRPRTAIAVFNQTLNRLTVRILAESGVGSVLVNGSPFCSISAPLQSQTCTRDYTPSTQVVLTAVSALGSIHLDWGGACAGVLPEISNPGNICGGLMSSPVTVDARFRQAATLRYAIGDSDWAFDPVSSTTVTLSSPGRRPYAPCFKDASVDVLSCPPVDFPVGVQVTYAVDIVGGSFLGFFGEIVPPECENLESPVCTFVMPPGGVDFDAVVSNGME